MRLPSAPLLALALAACACGEEPPPERFPLRFVATADELPLAGVRFSAGDLDLGETNTAGVLEAVLTGREGQTIPLSAACPEGYRSADALPALTLHRVRSIGPSAGARAVTFRVECRPALRTSVLVVRAGGVADLPIEVDGREIARTDGAGLAHVEVRHPPFATLEVVLRTRDRPDLSPADPPRTFVVPDADEVLVVDQAFTRPPEPPPPRRRGPRNVAPAPTIPQRITSGARR